MSDIVDLPRVFGVVTELADKLNGWSMMTAGDDEFFDGERHCLSIAVAGRFQERRRGRAGTIRHRK